MAGVFRSAILSFGLLALLVCAAVICSAESLPETPLFQKWQMMDGDIRKLRDRLPVGKEPETSREAQEIAEIMKQIITIYNQAAVMFSSTETFMDQPDQERQWCGHMRRSCRIYSDAWRKRATSMEETATRLRGEGK